MPYILPILAATLADGNKLMKIEGFQGRNVSFQCSHKLAWTYNKYFCKDPCGSEKDRLATVKSGGRAESGRVTLVDSGDGSFTVTLSHLQLSDSHQKYWCGVDRPGLDTYTQIQLTVKKGMSSFYFFWVYFISTLNLNYASAFLLQKIRKKILHVSYSSLFQKKITAYKSIACELKCIL